MICESPALRNFAEPGVFIIMTSDSIDKKKDISHLQRLPHVMFKYEELEKLSQFLFVLRMAAGINIDLQLGDSSSSSMTRVILSPSKLIDDQYCEDQRRSNPNDCRNSAHLSSSISEISFPSLAFIRSRSCFIPATAWKSCFSGSTGSGISLLI